MTLREIERKAQDEVVVRSNAPDGLLAIRQPGCAAAIWERRPLSKFQGWIDDLSPENLPQSRVILRADVVCDALTNVAHTCGTPECPHRDLLIDDISALAAIFADIMRCDYLRLRLGETSSAAHRHFHVARGSARLICTYRGAGTQYGVSLNGSDPARIDTVPTCSPIILRGAHWPEVPISGLLHRAPPSNNPEEHRLVLVLDPVLDPANEPDRQFVH